VRSVEVLIRISPLIGSNEIATDGPDATPVFRHRFYSGVPVMRTSPSIVPSRADQDTYLVLDSFGLLGRAWRETDEESTDRETLIRDLLTGEYESPVRIVAFNTAEGWSRDVTVDIADEVRRRYVECDEVPASVLGFLETAKRR
jgi:hypothetical protein